MAAGGVSDPPPAGYYRCRPNRGRRVSSPAPIRPSTRSTAAGKSHGGSAVPREHKFGASPSPVVIQRRAQAARHARASATLLRVAVLVGADILVMSLAYTAI